MKDSSIEYDVDVPFFLAARPQDTSLKSAEIGVTEVEAFCARRLLDDLSEPHCGLPSATRTPVHTGVSVG
jgi:hypothetical protein